MDYKLEQPIKGTIKQPHYQCTIEWRNGKFIADEPKVTGGQDAGPDPYSLLLSSLTSCTLITLRMYIDRKEWDIPEIAVTANFYTEKEGETDTTWFDRDIVFLSPTTDEQKTKLREIATHCPVSKILEGNIKVRTFVLRDAETEKVVKYANKDITVLWKPDLCQHSKRCWQQLPEVFDYKVKKWINPDGAPSGKIIEQVQKCPSGALTFVYNEG